MRNIVLIVAALVIAIGAFFLFEEATEGPAEEVGEAVDDAVSDVAN